jgi:YD repeat-containing protein
VTRPDGGRLTSTSYDPDGTSTTSYYDQSGNLSNHVVTQTDGSTITQPLPEPGGDRYRIYADPHGTITHVDVFHAGGATSKIDYVTTVDGRTTEMTTTTDVHGNVLSTTSRDSGGVHPQDPVTTEVSPHSADAPITIAQPDGNVVTFYPDGGQVVQFPNGAWVQYAPTGAEIGRG